MTESFSLIDKVIAAYPSAHPVNLGYFPEFFIQRELATLTSFIKSDNLHEGCKSQTICI